MISTRTLPLALLLAASAASQADRDILSPFRDPDQDYPPPDAVYAALRTMKNVAEGPGRDALSYDPDGREVCEHPAWSRAFRDLGDAMRQGYEGDLAQIMRRSRSAEDREIAFYGAFYGTNVPDVINLISHIPGEPERRIREQALPRAIAYLRVHLQRRFGDLSADQQKALRDQRPAVGSPAAKARGITEDYTDETWLFGLNVKPFLELLDAEAPLDRAQALWFFKELMFIRPDLAHDWLRPQAPRIRRAATSPSDAERNEAFGLIAALDPEKRSPPGPDATEDEIHAWLDTVLEDVFPPVHRVSSGLVHLYPGRLRDRIVAAGQDVLRRGAMGRFVAERLPNGEYYRGIELNPLPEPLDELGFPTGAVVTAVNAQAVTKEAQLLDFLTKALQGGTHTFVVEYVRNQKVHAVEIRVIG